MADEVINAYADMKTNKSKASFLILKIKDKKEIIIDVAGPEDDKMGMYEWTV